MYDESGFPVESRLRGSIIVANPLSCLVRDIPAPVLALSGLPSEKERHAMKILKKAEESQIVSGKDPMGLAASALYLSTLKMDEKNTQKEFALAAGVTEVTIRNRCKGLKLLDI